MECERRERQYRDSARISRMERRRIEKRNRRIKMGAGIAGAVAAVILSFGGARLMGSLTETGFGSTISGNKRQTDRLEEAGNTSDGTIQMVSGVSTENAEGKTASSAQSWNLLLVNSTHPLPDDFSVSLTNLKNNDQVDTRIVDDLQAMFDAARAEGLDPHINSSYRTRQMQQEEMQEKIASYENEGMEEAAAVQAAAMVVAQPGTSEHETGLALDISSASQDNDAVYEWLYENAAAYGFILRYPEDKTAVTGISYEPWHYRYVGQAAAEEIMSQGLCLEEYLA